MPFIKGQSGNPEGRPKNPPTTEGEKLFQTVLKRTVKSMVAEHEAGLAEALPEVRTALINQVRQGKMEAIKEIHDVLGARKKDSGLVNAIQINIGDKENYT